MVDADGRNRWKVSFPNIEAGMFASGWSPDGKQVLYTEAIGSSINDVTLIIATLHPTRREVIDWKRVPVPKMPIYGETWGADGKSILITLDRQTVQRILTGTSTASVSPIGN